MCLMLSVAQTGIRVAVGSTHMSPSAWSLGVPAVGYLGTILEFRPNSSNKRV